MIRVKAKTLYGKLIEKDPHLTDKAKPFTASKGWFEKFKIRNSVKSVKLHGEAASADEEAAETFKVVYRDIVDEDKYSRDQQYNMDETGLVWKKMPGRSFISRKNRMKKGHKATKQRITIVLCSNLSGSHMLKPLVINTSLRPRAFKKKKFSPEQQGFHWCANKRLG